MVDELQSLLESSLAHGFIILGFGEDCNVGRIDWADPRIWREVLFHDDCLLLQQLLLQIEVLLDLDGCRIYDVFQLVKGMVLNEEADLAIEPVLILVSGIMDEELLQDGEAQE